MAAPGFVTPCGDPAGNLLAGTVVGLGIGDGLNDGAFLALDAAPVQDQGRHRPKPHGDRAGAVRSEERRHRGDKASVRGLSLAFPKAAGTRGRE